VYHKREAECIKPIPYMEVIPPDSHGPWTPAKALAFLQKVTYGGAVGKQTVIAVVALIALTTGFVCSVGHISAVYVIVGGVLLVVAGSFISIHRTLANFPDLSTLDGPDWLKYQKWTAAKGKPEIPVSLPVPSSGKLQLPPPEEEPTE
jgi:hypothetical protein